VHRTLKKDYFAIFGASRFLLEHSITYFLLNVIQPTASLAFFLLANL